jgi:hypothetical protein
VTTSIGHVLFFEEDGERLEVYCRNGLHYSAPASVPVEPDGYRAGEFRCGRNPDFDELLRRHLALGTRVVDGHGRKGTYQGPTRDGSCLVTWDHGADSPVRSSYRSIRRVLA